MQVGVLGTSVAADDHDTVSLGGPKQRALLAALALHHGRAVAVDTLADLVWDGAPPPGAAGTLQGYVAGLRRALEPDRTSRGSGTLLVTEQPGYALRLPDGALDVTAFEDAVAAVHAEAAPLAEVLLGDPGDSPAPTDPAQLARLDARASDALALWRGTPYADLADPPAVSAERARLEELRLLAVEDRCVLALLLGRHAPVAAGLDALTRQHPLRERFWALRALALAGGGRQADALAVLQEVRALLDEELGLEPGAELRAVQLAVLRQETGAVPRPAPAATVPPPPPPDPTGPPGGWPLTGRDAELAALTSTLDGVLVGDGPAYAALTGEPGIGKTRLGAELAGYAAAAGARVVVGRCSQDDGAPPLWPWATALAELGSTLPTSSGEMDGGEAFRAWQEIVGAVLSAAADRTTLLLLDDLHWADVSTLRVLRLLAETAPAGTALMVVATWREHPVPSGALADVAESFARRHAVRLRLRGLGAPDAARILGEVTASAPTQAEATALARRTDGNPFFMVEFARLARERGDLAALMAEEDPPAAVQEVLSRRLDGLPAPTRGLLEHAGILGRHFELDLLAASADIDEDAALDALDAALDAGLVTEDGIERFRFTHALVRDTALSGLPRTRRARIHARAAAALVTRTGRETELARHWLAAGPRYRSEAWRAAAAAGRAAAEVHAFVEALEMLEHALREQDLDEASGSRERFEILESLADVLRRAGRWLELREVTHEAVAVATEAGDLDLRVRAGVMTSTGALWQASNLGQADAELVAELRDILRELPPGDDPRTCRVMMALAVENYYGSAPYEREALAEQAVAMAERLGDPRLRLWAQIQACIALWRGDTAEQRHRLSASAAELATELGDEIARISALTLNAAVAGELGWIDEMEATGAVALEAALRTRHLYAQVVLESLDVAWLAMRDRMDEVEERIERMVALGQQVSITGFEESLTGAITMQMLWQGRDEEMLEALTALDGTTWLPVSTTITAMYCRTGRVAEARAYFDAHPDEIERAVAEDTWFSPMARGMAAETALHLGEPALGARAYALLAGLSGRPCCAGSGNAMGPVDIYLAMAAAATGETALATRHADRAEEQCRAWRVPLAAQWVRRERDRFGF